MTRAALFLPCALLAAGLLASAAAQAADTYSETTVSIGYAPRDTADNIAGTGTNDHQRRMTYRLEHFSTHAYGDNYLAGSVYVVPSGSAIGGDGGGSSTRSSMMDLAYAGHLSGNKLLGKPPGEGAVKDVVITGLGLFSDFYGYRRVGLGAGVMWNVPGVPVLETSLVLYRQLDDNNFNWTRPLLRVYLFKPFELGGQKMSVGGFVHYRGIDRDLTSGRSRLYIEQELLAYVGQASFGLRLEHHGQQGGGNLNYLRPSTDARTTASLVAKYSF